MTRAYPALLTGTGIYYWDGRVLYDKASPVKIWHLTGIPLD